MIRKPPAEWQRKPSPTVKTFEAAVELADGGARLARRGGQVARGGVHDPLQVLGLVVGRQHEPGPGHGGVT